MKCELENPNKRKRRRIVIGLFFILFFLLTRFYHRPEVVINGEVNEASFAKTMSDEELMKYLQDKADKNNIHLKLESTMVFSDSDSTGDVNIINPPKNVYNIRIITFVKEKKVYDSGLIKPKEYVTKGRLLTKLKKGIHDTVSEVLYYDNDNKVVGQSNVIGKLSINN